MSDVAVAVVFFNHILPLVRFELGACPVLAPAGPRAVADPLKLPAHQLCDSAAPAGNIIGCRTHRPLKRPMASGPCGNALKWTGPQQLRLAVLICAQPSSLW
ncbi:hypothetical protein CCMA1212_005644 [Trichoderma ghanense]|uniref:SSCRP protein n=1 Tax=Trichoderma ghanense TaxID=65468 RepID=A0ABY2H3I0_9HYPO